jgi:2-oxoisovalerate dehydrogenase E1 component
VTTTPQDLDPLEIALCNGTRALATSSWSGAPLDVDTARALFTAQTTSRALDHVARHLRALGHGHYTIGSAGHEGNAAVALALRPSDPALLHYRSGGFYLARSGQVPGHDGVGDVLRGLLARSTEPIAGGRHKVFGSVELGVVPMTSTIGSHLPRAVGLATALGQRGPDVHGRWPTDSVVVASLGDASLNHSTVQGALNWASRSAHAGLRVPLLVVVEDNGLGISVRTPRGWVAASLAGRPGFSVEEVDGHDPGAVLAATDRLAATARDHGRPGILHLHTVRFLGHAGSDVETAYRRPVEVRDDLALDPLLGTAATLVAHGTDPDRLAEEYLTIRAGVLARAMELLDEPTLTTAADVVAPLAPHDADAVAARAAELAATPGDTLGDEPLTLARTVTATLDQVLRAVPGARVFGEDVGRKGGVYGLTRGLQRSHGPDRVFDMLLDEQSILGMALGAALDDNLPIPEIQYLAYLHNAEDQLRGEAATMRFFSRGQYTNGMVVRVAGLAYQQGFGGHFHNDNGVAVLRDVPGLVVACPAHPADAGPMLRTLVAGAEVEGMVSVLLEPIARYHTRDLHDAGDGGWLAAQDDAAHAPLGRARVHGDGTDVALVTFGNGLFQSLRVARRLAEEDGVAARVVDLRWLAPLPTDDVLAAARACGRVLVVDETRRSGGVGEGVLAELVQAGFTGPMARVASHDSLVPLGAAADLVLLQEADVLTGARALLAR